MDRRQDAEGQADHQCDDHRERQQTQGGQQPRPHLLGDRPTADDGKAEVALHDVGEPVVVADRNRLVQPELVPPLIDLRARHSRKLLWVEARQNWIAGGKREHGIGDEGDPEQDHEGDQDAAQKIGAHGPPETAAPAGELAGRLFATGRTVTGASKSPRS